jgi:GTP-binding protein YchF
MGFTCGIVGVPGCGKTNVYNAITAAGAEGFGAQEANRAVIEVPDERVQPLVEMYSAPKAIYATMEVVDIPGLKKGSTADGGRGSKLLAHIKDVDALLHVVRCFEDKNVPFEYDTIDPARDVETIDLEMIVADAQTIQNKLDRLAKKARTGDKDVKRELELCEKIKAAMENGTPARKQNLTEEELEAVRECHLVSLKKNLYVANIKTLADRDNPHVAALRKIAAEEGAETIAICARDEAEIIQLDPADREEFLAELGLEELSRDPLIRASYRALNLADFLTAGPKEIHVWTCAAGSKAPQAAGKIHSDMEAGFIRMEVIRYEDLIELGSEAAVSKAGRQRIEGKDYVVQDGDIVVIRFNK